MAEWADKAICYRWMHERTERIFASKDMAYMFPVIILSTVTGAANFALDSVIQDQESKKYAQLGLGGLSILTGIISTIANRLGYGPKSEAHKGAAVLWGKFQRLIAIELSLHPNERSDCMYFLKSCRSELDRLIEQSPTIPDSVIAECRTEFAGFPKVRKPEIVGDIDTTHIFVDTNSRLKEMAKEAAITIQQKKGVLKQIVLDDLEPRISRVIEHSTLPAIKEELRKEVQRSAAEAARAAVAAGRAAGTGLVGEPPKPVIGAATVERQAAERAQEVQRLAMSGVVSEMRRKMAMAEAKYAEKDVPALAILAEVVPAPAQETVIYVSDESEDEDDEEAEEEAEETTGLAGDHSTAPGIPRDE